MQRGVRSLHADVASFSISLFNGADAPWMIVCWSSLKKHTSTYVAMQRGVRSMHDDVTSCFSISSLNGGGRSLKDGLLKQFF